MKMVLLKNITKSIKTIKSKTKENILRKYTFK